MLTSLLPFMCVRPSGMGSVTGAAAACLLHGLQRCARRSKPCASSICTVLCRFLGESLASTIVKPGGAGFSDFAMILGVGDSSTFTTEPSWRQFPTAPDLCYIGACPYWSVSTRVTITLCMMACCPRWACATKIHAAVTGGRVCMCTRACICSCRTLNEMCILWQRYKTRRGLICEECTHFGCYYMPDGVPAGLPECSAWCARD